MKPVLFDTNSLLWYGNGIRLRSNASEAISNSPEIFASAISVWELTFAARKNHPLRRPDLRGLTARSWFDDAIDRFGIDVLPVTTDIASEAAGIAPLYGSGDPGDCFLIATAHIHQLTLITRDARILDFAKANPDYLSVTQC